VTPFGLYFTFYRKAGIIFCHNINNTKFTSWNLYRNNSYIHICQGEDGAGASTVSAHAGMGATAPGGGLGMGMG
jgi:hypothetical protein